MNDASNESPTSHSGPRQAYASRRIPLVYFGGGAGGVGGTIYVRLNTPDPRLRCSLSLVGVPVPGSTAPGRVVLAGRGITVWPYAVIDDQVVGGRGTPVSDMIPGITQAAPLAIPVHAGLGGWGREIDTISDGVEAEIVIPVQAPGGTQGQLCVQAHWAPDSNQVIPWSQWDELRSNAEPVVFGDVIRVP